MRAEPRHSSTNGSGAVCLQVEWTNPGVRELSLSAHWVSWLELPWVGMETQGCPYLDGGAGCGNNTVTRTLIGPDPEWSTLIGPDL